MSKFLIILNMLLGYVVHADTILLDPVFKPPQFTTAARPTCPSTFGCFGFNTNLKKFEWNDGAKWQPLGNLDLWETGKSYITGEIKNSGSNDNWLFKVTQDHTSTNVPADFKSGKILAIAPPLITTGVQAGGQSSLAGLVATVQAGTGYIALYGPAPTAFPQITIVEWGLQTITLPATGIHTLFINALGVLESIPGIGIGVTAEQDTKISVGIIDMNLRLAYDRETYPTNPVGQLRGLAFFFGGMTRGLSYTATGLQMARSQHDVYYWGAHTIDPYNPNTKTEPAISPVTFFEYQQNGPVIPATRKTTFQTGVYDNAGTLTTIPGNGWCFTRIYSAPGTDDYIMYCQNTYLNETDAKAAAIATTFIKPVDLTLTKFSSWFVFQKNDADLSDNLVTVCEPFGCDKIGTSAGGGGGGAGDVVGPTSSTDNAIARFDLATGKLIQNSGVLIDDSNNLSTPGRISAVGQIYSIPPANLSNLIFDFNNGNNQYTTANCGAVQLNNTVDGGVYSIVIAGTTPALCSFSGTPSFTVHMPVPHGSTTAATGKVTIYYFTRLNGHMMVGWSTGI